MRFMNRGLWYPMRLRMQPVPNLSPHRRDPALVALGEAIRGMRQQRGLSQDALALKAEIDRSYFGRVERGDNNMAMLTLVKIAAALEVSVAELVIAAGL